jgi:hypothetical protein
MFLERVVAVKNLFAVFAGPVVVIIHHVPAQGQPGQTTPFTNGTNRGVVSLLRSPAGGQIFQQLLK